MVWKEERNQCVPTGPERRNSKDKNTGRSFLRKQRQKKLKRGSGKSVFRSTKTEGEVFPPSVKGQAIKQGDRLVPGLHSPRKRGGERMRRVIGPKVIVKSSHS